MRLAGIHEGKDLGEFVQWMGYLNNAYIENHGSLSSEVSVLWNDSKFSLLLFRRLNDLALRSNFGTKRTKGSDTVYILL